MKVKLIDIEKKLDALCLDKVTGVLNLSYAVAETTNNNVGMLAQAYSQAFEAQIRLLELAELNLWDVGDNWEMETSGTDDRSMATFVNCEVSVENKKTVYEMKYTCFNCGTSFIHAVPVGIKAEGKGGECPYCGVRDGKPRYFMYRKS